LLKFLPLALLAFASCTVVTVNDLPTRGDPLPLKLPAMQTFSARSFATGVTRANTDIARDFLELAFEMESGKTLERLTRFEEPVTIALAQDVSVQFSRDLDALLNRLRREAKIDIRLAKTGSAANIVVETLPRKTLQAAVPQAACFVVPRITSWENFKRNRRSGALDWSTLDVRDRTTIFIPDDVSAQETRDCMHEEIAQALGPLNDLYRLSDSVFNDDNINTVLTSFDMLILRTYYSPALKNGMTRAQVAAVLPTVLARLNPAGKNVKPDGLQRTPRKWINTIESALAPRSGQSRRLAQGRRAVDLARAEGWTDNRLGFSLFALGRLSLGLDSETAAESFSRAFALYAQLFGTDDIHTSHVALQLAAYSLSTGNSTAALKLINGAIPSVSRAQNAGLLATLLMIKAEALDFDEKHADAATVRLDAIGWARYGFGSEDEIRARLAEISALKPRKKQAGA